MHARASNSGLVEPLPKPERTLNRRLRRRNRRVPYDQRSNPPQYPRIVYLPILNINYIRHILDIHRNYDLIDDEPMWAVDRVVALTPGSAITIPETANEFAIKAQYKELQSRAKQPIPDLDNDDIPMSRKEKIADISFQYPIGIAENIFVEVGKFTFPANFVILEMEEDSKFPLILGRPFLHTADAQEPHAKKITINIALLNDKFIAMTADEIYDSESDTEEPPFEKITINTDYKIKTSLEEPSTELELKTLPDNLEYVFLEEPSFLPIPVLFADSPWVSPIHCVPKKGGITVVTNENDELVPTRIVTCWRVCIDYRKLNEATAKDHFPLPFMDQMLERLAGNKYLCFLDGFSGYFQIPIDPNDQEKITFTCPFGTYAYRRMPFELCNALATFQRFMLAIFHDMIEESVEVFMDDFSVFRNSFDKCLNNLDKMLQHCKDAHLVLNWEKCHFMVKEGIVFGHKVSSAGLEVDKVWGAEGSSAREVQCKRWRTVMECLSTVPGLGRAVFLIPSELQIEPLDWNRCHQDCFARAEKSTTYSPLFIGTARMRIQPRLVSGVLPCNVRVLRHLFVAMADWLVEPLAKSLGLFQLSLSYEEGLVGWFGGVYQWLTHTWSDVSVKVSSCFCLSDGFGDGLDIVISNLCLEQ
ncbi:reverse transcriptase domain-containing protein [Tanacetum coccineum]